MPLIAPIREASVETRVAQQVPTLFSADPGQCWASRRREDGGGQAGGGRMILDKQEVGGAPLHLYVHLLCVAYGLGCVPAVLPRLVYYGF